MLHTSHRQRQMASEREYEAAVSKAERSGMTSLNRIERELVERVSRNTGSLGGRARNVLK